MPKELRSLYERIAHDADVKVVVVTGATLALFCDVVYMSSAARIGDPHVPAGLVTSDGGCVLWPMLLGIYRPRST